MNAVDIVAASYIKGLRLHRKMEAEQIADYLRLDLSAVRQVIEGTLLPFSTPALEEFLPAPTQAAVVDFDAHARAKELEWKLEAAKSVITMLAAAFNTTPAELFKIATEQRNKITKELTA